MTEITGFSLKIPRVTCPNCASPMGGKTKVVHEEPTIGEFEFFECGKCGKKFALVVVTTLQLRELLEDHTTHEPT